MFSKPIELMIYHANISSNLYHCTDVWGNVCNTNLNNLFILQKCAFRLILNATKLDHTTPIALSLYCLYMININLCVSLVHSILHKIINISLTFSSVISMKTLTRSTYSIWSGRTFFFCSVVIRQIKLDFLSFILDFLNQLIRDKSNAVVLFFLCLNGFLD